MNIRVGWLALALTLSRATLVHGQLTPEGSLVPVTGAQVIVSAREARIIFAPERDSVWWWRGGATGPVYGWSMSPVVADRVLFISAETQIDSLDHTYRSLDSLARSLRPFVCPRSGACRTNAGVSARADGRSMSIVVRDTTLIQALFRFRVDTMTLMTRTPTGGTWTTASVRYIEPKIPEPDAAFMRWLDSLGRPIPRRPTVAIRRVGTLFPAPISAVPGESVPVQAEIIGPDTVPSVVISWSVEDTSVARVVPSSRATATIQAVREGKTSIVATVEGARRPSRTVIAVTRPVSRIRLVPIDSVFFVGEAGRYRLVALDGTGNEIADVSAELREIGGGTSSISSTLTAVGARYLLRMRPDTVTLIARSGELADTLRVAVRPRRPPPRLPRQ